MPCVAHCVVEMIMKCLNVRRVNPFPFYMSKMHYVWKCCDLTKNVSLVFKLIIVMINSKQRPILAIQTVFGSESA